MSESFHSFAAIKSTCDSTCERDNRGETATGRFTVFTCRRRISRAARTNAAPTTVFFPGETLPPPRPWQLPQREGGRRAGTHPSREPSLPGEREERSTTEKFRGGIHPKKLCVSPRDMVKSRLKFISIHPYCFILIILMISVERRKENTDTSFEIVSIRSKRNINL